MELFYSIDELVSILGKDQYKLAHMLKEAGVRMTYQGEPADLSRWTGGVSCHGNSVYVTQGYYDDPSPSSVLVLADSLPVSWIRKIESSEAESDGVSSEGETGAEARQPGAQTDSGAPDSDEPPAHSATPARPLVSREPIPRLDLFALPGVKTTDLIELFGLTGKKWTDIRDTDKSYWSAIHTRGGRGKGMHRWKLADFAICLLKTGERTLPGALRATIANRRPEWLPEFESQLEEYLNKSGKNRPV